MKEEKTTEKTGYFEAALSDFVFDAAAGGAIRHLVDRGYSVEQIMTQLSYPVPRSKVEKAVYRHLLESGILLNELSVEETEGKIILLSEKTGGKTPEVIAEHITRYGEENSYMECPFGLWKKEKNGEREDFLSCLSAREREYIEGINWEQKLMYHRLNSRMREIGMKLVRYTKWEWGFYFRDREGRDY